jgi:uncharacterized protein
VKHWKNLNNLITPKPKTEMKILLIGATGFIGKHLFDHLKSKRHQVVVVSRNKAKAQKLFPGHQDFAEWDGKDEQAFAAIVEKSGAVINLAGANLAGKRWNEHRKQVILNSRVNSTRAVVNAINSVQEKPEVLIQASAVGYYGAHPEKTFTETDPSGEGFLAEVTKKWEAAAKGLDKKVRLVFLRSGAVIGKDGGALQKMEIPFKFGVGGHIGSGKQWFSWIHIDDEVRAIAFLLENKNTFGAFNLTAPQPVKMNVFAKSLGEAMSRPSWLHVPAFAINLLFGQMGKETILQGQRAIPEKLQDHKFQFLYSDAKSALQQIYTAT